VESVGLQLSQRAERLDDAVRRIAEELRSFDRYPQGFYFVYESSLNDNLDATHSLIHKLNVPLDTWILDAVKVWIYGEKYRANVQGLASGGGTVVTSEATIPATVTSGDPSPATTGNTTPSQTTSGAPSIANTSISGHRHAVNITCMWIASADECWLVTGYYILGVPAGTGHKNFNGPSGAQGGQFLTTSTNAHSHPMPHLHNISFASHIHGMDHLHQVPGSAHSHQVDIPDHIHALNFGIYEAPSATANISLKIIDPDNQETNLGVIGTGIFSKEAWDLTQYFTKKGNYQLVFSADGPARVRSMVFIQPFILPEGES